MAGGPPGQYQDQFVATGSRVFRLATAQVSTSTGAALQYFGRLDFGRAFSSFGLRMRLTGAGTSGSYQLVGSVATSSDPNSVLRPLTTFDLAVNTSEDVVWVTGKPVTSVALAQTTASSSGTSFDAWLCATP